MTVKLSVDLREEPPQNTAVIEVDADADTVGDKLGNALNRLYQGLAASAVAPSGPPFAIYRNTDGGGWHMTVGVPSAELIDPAGEVRPMVHDPGRVAVGMHRGSYDDIATTWNAMEQWVREHDLQLSGPPYERYLVAPSTTGDTPQWRTEICWPVRETH